MCDIIIAEKDINICNAFGNINSYVIDVMLPCIRYLITIQKQIFGYIKICLTDLSIKVTDKEKIKNIQKHIDASICEQNFVLKNIENGLLIGTYREKISGDCNNFNLLDSIIYFDIYANEYEKNSIHNKILQRIKCFRALAKLKLNVNYTATLQYISDLLDE